jgi:predicted nucleic acid-binding protein
MAAVTVEFTSAIGVRATEWQLVGQKLFDAKHLASAENSGVEVFVTCDDNLIKRAKRLPTPMRIVNPVELFRELFP